MARNNDLGKDKIIPLLLRLALPAMLAQFVNVLYSIVDRIYIGNIPIIGNAALAGVGVCSPIVTLITSFSFLMGLGGAPLMAMKLGEKNENEAQKILSNCFIMLMAISIVLTVVFLVLKDSLLMWFGASADTFVYANDYMTIYVLGSVFAILSVGLNNFIVCQGYAKTGMLTVLLGAVINIILDPIFIFVFDMGVAGAAIATVIAQFCSCLWVVLFLFSKKTSIRIKVARPNTKIMSRVLKNGLSPFLIISTDSILIIVLNSVLQKHGGELGGDTLITAATIVLSFMQIITMPMGGIDMGVQPILSFNYGANDMKRVKQGYFGMLSLCLIFTSIMIIISFTIPHLFVRIFTTDETITAVAIWGIKTYTLGIVFLAVQYASVDSLVALNESRLSVILSLTRKIVIMLTLTITLPLLFGWKGAFYAEPIADILSCIITGTTFALCINKILNKRNLTKIN